jgi:hypothetical protein
MANKKYVWEFTNQRKLTKKEFITYFEKKVFKTIRKFEMLPKNKIFTLKKSTDLNTKILTKILETKFPVMASNKPNTSSENLSTIAEDIFGNILEGKFKGAKPKDKLIYPLYYHSDAEIKLYAELTNIKGAKPKRKKHVQVLFNKFRKKNPDLEITVVNQFNQVIKITNDKIWFLC